MLMMAQAFLTLESLHQSMLMMAQAFLTLESLHQKKTSRWTLPRTRREIQYVLFTWTGFCAYCGCPA